MNLNFIGHGKKFFLQLAFRERLPWSLHSLNPGNSEYLRCDQNSFRRGSLHLETKQSDHSKNLSFYRTYSDHCSTDFSR